METGTTAPAAASSVSETTTTTAFTAAALPPEGIVGERDEAPAAIPTTAPANAQFYDEWQEISKAAAAIPTTTAGVIRIAPPREEVVCNAAADCYTRSEKTATTTTAAPAVTPDPLLEERQRLRAEQYTRDIEFCSEEQNMRRKYSLYPERTFGDCMEELQIMSFCLDEHFPEDRVAFDDCMDEWTASDSSLCGRGSTVCRRS